MYIVTRVGGWSPALARCIAGLFLVLSVLMPGPVSAVTATHHLINSFGGEVVGASRHSITAGAQGHPVGMFADSEDVWVMAMFNFAGLLQPVDDVVLSDMDNDGMSDAVDPDSDNDGFADIEEILGSMFGGVATDPHRADTDGDGDSDDEEYETGTNPADPDSKFKITRVIYNSTTDVRIRFRSVGGRQYELFRADTLEALQNAVSIDGIEGVPGAGPFNEGVTEFIDVPFTEDYFYGVRLVP